MSRHFDQWTISRCRLYRVSTIRNGHGHDAIAALRAVLILAIRIVVCIVGVVLALGVVISSGHDVEQLVGVSRPVPFGGTGPAMNHSFSSVV